MQCWSESSLKYTTAHMNVVWCVLNGKQHNTELKSDGSQHFCVDARYWVRWKWTSEWVCERVRERERGRKRAFQLLRIQLSSQFFFTFLHSLTISSIYKLRKYTKEKETNYNARLRLLYLRNSLSFIHNHIVCFNWFARFSFLFFLLKMLLFCYCFCSIWIVRICIMHTANYPVALLCYLHQAHTYNINCFLWS